MNKEGHLMKDKSSVPIKSTISGIDSEEINNQGKKVWTRPEMTILVNEEGIQGKFTYGTVETPFDTIGPS